MAYEPTEWKAGDIITSSKMNKIEAQLAVNTEELENVRDSIAEVYDSTKTYVIGDYAYYNEVLYRCTTAITTVESWNSGHWTEVKVGSEIKDVKNSAAAANSDVIADTYDATKTYAVGDYVIYNGKLYRCNTTISTAEAWTAGHWMQTNVGAEVGGLKSAPCKDEITSLLLADPIPDTVQAITFDASGNVQTITHSRDGAAVRTDAFVFADVSITETRTLATGESLTIVTDTNTLQTTTTYAKETGVRREL